MEKIFIDIREENRWITKYFPNKDLITIEELLGVIEDLDSELEAWKEKYEDLELDLKENYKFVGQPETEYPVTF